jgi:hypothetical protein
VILLRSKAESLQYQHGEGDTPGEGEEAREESASKIREEAARDLAGQTVRTILWRRAQGGQFWGRHSADALYTFL